ncbi:transposase domain-containing protein [Xanthomonas fragariae]|uniref:transposase domain-containing protein n=1 Tax=Xanthomonas fragariae TaxID=48664 RepID=UPI003D18A9EA
MSLQQQLFDLGDLFNFSDLSTFTQNIPVEWVASALELSSQASIRRRRLASDQVLWLVLGMALLRDEPVHEVARRLNICAQGLASEDLLARSGVSQARDWAPIRSTACSQRLGRNGAANATATARHWLTPARKGLVAEESMRYGTDDRLLRMRVWPQARKRNPALPTHCDVGRVSYLHQGKRKSVLTWLPATTDSAKFVATLYQERWEIELGLRDIKSSMQHKATPLRSKKIDLVYQHVWGLLLAYDIIRREASQAAAAFGRTPWDIQFEPVCQYIAVQLIVMAAANPASATARRLSQLPQAVRACSSITVQDHRPRPTRPRTVKISKTRYPVDRKAAPLK